MTALNNQRVSARVNPEIYEAITHAAEISGATLNQFIVQSAYEKARDVIEKEQLIKMTKHSATDFFKALDNPPKPNARLKKAVELYKESNNDI